MSSTTTSFNFSGTNITMTCSPVKKKVEEVVFEMGGEPIKKLKMPYTMKDVMIAEGYKFVDDGDGDGITGGRGGFPLSYGGGGV